MILPAFHIGNSFFETVLFQATWNEGKKNAETNKKQCLLSPLTSSGKISEVIYTVGKEMNLIFSRSVNTINQRNHSAKESVWPTFLFEMVQPPSSGIRILRLSYLLTFQCLDQTSLSVLKTNLLFFIKCRTDVLQ
jgi:hypothetical protein